MEKNSDKLDFSSEAGNFSYAENYAFDAGVGINEETVRYISRVKNEDEWLTKFRLDALKIFREKENPTHWATQRLDELDFSKIRYYLAKDKKNSRTWDDVPDDVKQT
ncbi:MAG: Fe-S cluster assembly protein SufB, partial [Opitutales bacterium]|nr:Fe-S cluster assembly protein SufB [Opitutales bacterium]